MKLPEIKDVAGDLVTHLITKLHKQINEVGDTAERAGLDGDIIMRVIITALIFELVKAARHMEMDLEIFLSVIGTMYREVEEAEGKV